MERLCCVVTNTKINFLIQCYIYFSVLATVYWSSDNESNCVLVGNEFVRLLLENQFLQDYTNSIKPCTLIMDKNYEDRHFQVMSHTLRHCV